MQVRCLSIHKPPRFADHVTTAELWLALLISIPAGCTVVPTCDLPPIEAAVARAIMLTTLCLLAEDVVGRFGSAGECSRGGRIRRTS